MEKRHVTIKGDTENVSAQLIRRERAKRCQKNKNCRCTCSAGIKKYDEGAQAGGVRNGSLFQST